MIAAIHSALLLFGVLANEVASSAFAQQAEARIPKCELVSVEKIWDAAPHNAFTDLVRWNNRFYCAFREGKGHAGDRGNLRIIVSENGASWESAGLLTHEKYDLRDAALSVTPDDQLMVLGGAQEIVEGRHITGTFVSFSIDGNEFSAPKVVIPLGRWLWRVTWHGNFAYGVSYGAYDNVTDSALHKTKDGEKFETVASKLFEDGQRPTEARLRFDNNGNCYCLHRRDGSTKNTAMLGTAKPPYTDWRWHDLGRRLGGPNFVQIPDQVEHQGKWIAAGRLYDNPVRTELCHLDIERGQLTPILRLPSGGDTSYPGMIWHDGLLWVSYYSSHEGKTSIYLAKVRFLDP